MLWISASVPKTMTERIPTEFQYGQGSTERDRELGDFQFVHS